MLNQLSYIPGLEHRIERRCKYDVRTRSAFRPARCEDMQRPQRISVTYSAHIERDSYDKDIREIVENLMSTSKGFASTVEQLARVVRDTASYDDEFLRPTTFAHRTAWLTLVGAALRMGNNLPEGWACADGEGGLSIAWRQADMKVVAFISAQHSMKQRLLHRRLPAGKSEVEELSSLALATRLKQLLCK